MLSSRKIIAVAASGLLATIAPPAAMAAAPTAIIPGLSQEIPGVRIGWTAHDLSAPVKAAQRDGKPVVALFVESPNCGWCMSLMENALRCPTFNTLAGKAHFVIADNFDKGAAGSDAHALAAGLGIDSYPTISILTFKGSNVSETYRIVGASSEQVLVESFAKGGLRATTPRSMKPMSAALGTFTPDGCLPGPGPMTPRAGAMVITPSK